MKTVEIGRKITTFAGIPITDNTKESDDKEITIRDILVQYVGRLFQAENKERALLAYRVAQRIYDCEEENIELEDAQFKLIQDATDNPGKPMTCPMCGITRHGAMIMGPVYEVLENAAK